MRVLVIAGSVAMAAWLGYITYRIEYAISIAETSCDLVSGLATKHRMRLVDYPSCPSVTFVLDQEPVVKLNR